MMQLAEEIGTEIRKSLPDPMFVMNKISMPRIKFLLSKHIDSDIAEIDLEMVKMKMMEVEEGVSWTKEQCDDGEVEYKRYLTLCRRFPYPNYSIVPNRIMDTMWHYHILDTRAYCRDSDSIFGGYFHHFPYFGMRGKEDAANLRKAFEKTKILYKEIFGERMDRTGEQNCWHDCEDRCWHACANEDPN